MDRSTKTDAPISTDFEASTLFDRIAHSRAALKSVVPQVLACFASCILLRWAELEDRERQAIAEFDGQDYEPILPSEVRIETWLHRPISEFESGIREEVIKRLQHRNSNSLRTWLSKVISNETISLPIDDPDLRRHVWAWLLSVVGRADLSIAAGRVQVEHVFDSLLQQASQRIKGFEVYTPQPVVDLMVDLASPQPGERIYDPCFGTGGLLVTAARRINSAATKCAAGEWERLRSQSIFGVESNVRAYAIATARIVLAGITQPGLELGDALERPRQVGSERFDLVLACPPWGYKSSDLEQIRHQHFRVPSRDLTTLFLQHAMDSLRPGGRAVLAVPDGTLFGRGADKQVRRLLLTEFSTEGVVSLPEGTLAPFTAIKSNLLIFRRTEPKSKVKFLVVSRLAGTNPRLQVPEERPKEISDKFRSTKFDDRFWSTPISDLEKRDWELVAKPSGHEELIGQISLIRKADPSIQERPLGKIARIFAGISYDKRNTQARGGQGSPIAVVPRG